MKIVAQFDPSVTETTQYGTGGSFNITQSGQVGLNISNDSIYGLQIFLSNGKNFYIPAWTIYPICMTIPSSTIYWVQYNSLASSTPPASTVVVELYDKGEKPASTTPVSLNRHYIGNTTPLSSSIDSLSNETSAVGTEVIDIGTVANNKLIDLFNDHFTMKVEQSGVAHTVLQGLTSGNPLKLGQVSDTTEVVGTLAVDENVLLVTNNTSFLQGKDSGGTARNMLVLDSANNVKFLSITGKDVFLFQITTGVNILKVQSTGIVVTVGASTIFTVDSTGVKVNTGSYQFPAGTGTLTSINHFSGTGNGTVATGVTNPTGIAFNPCTVSGSTQTIGGTTATSSVVTTGAGLAWSGWSYKG